MNQTEVEITFQINPRPTESVLLQIPEDALRTLEQVATSRYMPVEALLKLYIGNGLRQDISKLFSERQNHHIN